MNSWFDGEDWVDANIDNGNSYLPMALFFAVLCACVAVGFAFDFLS